MSRVPIPILRAVEAALNEHGHTLPIETVEPIGGGCIHNGHRLATSADAYFLKWNSEANAPAMFTAEEDGLAALRAVAEASDAGAIVPATFGRGSTEAGAWLVMEYIQPVAPLVGSGGRLGEALAALHAHGDEPFGWPTDNWIGSLPQRNGSAESWGAFWRDHRIVPQLERARGLGRAFDAIFDDVVAVIPAALADAESTSLLHGDLWSGNAFHAADGRPVFIDPAVYRGDGEVDLAMAELFGGFDTGVLEAYDRRRPISAEYHSHRRALYQLYYLLVHLNLFGHTYEPGARAAAERVVMALRSGG